MPSDKSITNHDMFFIINPLISMSLKITCISLVVIILLFLLNPASGQDASCISKDFIRSATYPGGGAAQTLVEGPENSFYMTGVLNNRLVVQRITNDGDTLWTKKYSNSNSVITGNARLIIDTDKNPLIAYDGNLFMKIDKNGNILSTKRITPSLYSAYFVDIKVLPGGDKIIVFYSSSNHVIARLSGDLARVKWSKQINSFNAYLKEMVIDNNKIIVVGSASMLYSFDNIGLAYMFSADNGSLIRENWFKVDDTYIHLTNVYKYNNGYIARGSLSMSSTAYTTDNHVIIRFDTALNITSAYKFGNIKDDYSLTLAVKPDGSFYGASGFSSNTLFFVDNKDSIRWAKRDVNMYTIKPANLMVTQRNVYLLSHGNYFLVGQNLYQGALTITKADLNANMINCRSESDSVSKISLTFSASETNTAIEDGNSFSIENDPSVATPFRLEGYIKCSGAITCTSVKIVADTNICSPAASILKARRNYGCNVPVSWSVINGPDQPASTVINDSTISYNFKKNGDYTAAVTLLSGCNTITDTAVLHVSLAANDLLGSDTSICPNESITITASAGFKNYRWDDGRRGNTIKINKAGMYKVSATDYCNKEWKDSILVEEFKQETFSSISDILKCTNDTAHYSIPSTFKNINWSPSDAAIIGANNLFSVYSKHNADLILTATDHNNCTVKDTISITVKAVPVLNIGNDTAICEGKSVMLNAGNDFDEFKWSTGAETSSVTVSDAGKYYVQVTALNGCKNSDTTVVKINPLPAINLGTDTAICLNSSITFAVQNEEGYSYLWQNNSTNNSFTTAKTGKFWLQVTDGYGCENSDTVLVTKLKSLPSNFLPADTTICIDYSFLVLPNKAYNNYKWVNGSTEKSIEITNPGTYWLKVTNEEGCEGIDSIHIKQQVDCTKAIFFPNAFTPNNDGHNDLFRPKVYGIMKRFHLVIYNRLGQKVFETNDVSPGWTGSIKSLDQNSETFIWQCEYQFANEPVRTAKGTVLLLR